MNDTQNVKALSISAVGATQLPGAALAFNRVVGDKSGTYKRLNAALGSLNPTVLRIAHQPRTSKSPVQRTLISVDQTLTRVDGLSNPLSEVVTNVSFQTNIPSGMTLVEWRAACALLFGALLEADGALLTAMYYGEY